MTGTHPIASISAYADGELPADECARVEAHLASCTECMRELALIKSIGEAMNAQNVSDDPPVDIWKGVHRRITQPLGWILVIAGVSVWIALAVIEWFRAGTLTAAWLSTTAVGIGIALLFVGVLHAQYREWRSSPYKDLER
jgi:anti-sigma factor RsiW